MKKLALILAMVCFVLVLGAAQEFKPTITVEGNAKLTAGVNLDTQIFGLTNSLSGDLKLSLIPEATVVKGEGATYGWIQLKEFKLEQGDVVTAVGDDGTVTTKRGLLLTNPKVFAKIVSGPMFFQIADETATKKLSSGGFSINNISDGNFINAGILSGAKVESASDLRYFYAGYDSEMVDFTLKAGSPNDYCADAEGTDLVWDINPSVALSVSGATVKAGAFFSTVENSNIGIGASAEYGLAINDKINVVPKLGFDYVLTNDDTDDLYSVGLGAAAKWGGVDKYKPYFTKDVASCGGSTFDLAADDVEMQGGASIGFAYNSNKTINLVAQVVEQRGDNGLVPALGAALTVEMADLTSELADSTLVVGGFANYVIGNLTPYARFVYGTDLFRLGAGFELTKVIANTTIFGDYNSFNLAGDDAVTGLLSAGVKISF